MRYASLLTRSRDLHLEYYAFEYWENDKCELKHLLDYVPSREIIVNYTKTCQGKEELSISDLDKRMNNWDVNNKETVAVFYGRYKDEFDKILSFEEFKKFYGEDEKDRECDYCRIKESEIETLRKKGEIKTKRLYTRGLKMEIDRKNPFGNYSVENIALCCYWCNNAKTDEFNAEEFKLIAKLIKVVWDNRLTK